MIGQEAYESWRSATIEFTKAIAEYNAGNKKAGVQARKLSTAIAGHLKDWRNASIEHDKVVSGKAPSVTPAVDETKDGQPEPAVEDKITAADNFQF